MTETQEQDKEVEKKQKPPKPTNDELATRWNIDHGDNTVYGLGEWRRYKDGVWYAVDREIIENEFMNILKAAKFEGIRPTDSLTNDVMSWAKKEAAIPDRTWDSDPDILVCKNGTLHIPTMNLREHNPGDYASYRLEFDYDPTVNAPIFEWALYSVIPEAAEFLQEFAGYALTTDTRYELAIWLYGPKGSGKSTIIEGIMAMLGERATVLGLAQIENSRFALGDLQGKTLATASEQPSMYLQATHVINAIISGEKIITERKFRDPITFRPFVKILWAMNEWPRVNPGNGLFRRVQVIEFPKLAKENQDPKVKEEIKTEGSGILNWALAGLQRLRERGRFEIPDCVKNATQKFEDNNDIPALFVSEGCITGPDLKTVSSKLYSSYRYWCLDNGHKPQSSTTLAEDWRRLGFERYRADGHSYWRGVGLKNE